MNVNSSQWNLKIGDPSKYGPFSTRAQMIDQDSMYPCPGVAPSLYCPTNGDPTKCVVCTKHMAYGMILSASWLKPSGLMAWVIDQLPFPHLPLSYTNQSVGVRYVPSLIMSPCVCFFVSDMPVCVLPPSQLRHRPLVLPGHV